MAVETLLKDFKNIKNTLLIAQAGIKGALKSLKKTRSNITPRRTRVRTPKNTVPAGRRTTSPAKRKQKQRVRNPSNLVIESRAVVPRKPSTQQPVKKSPST